MLRVEAIRQFQQLKAGIWELGRWKGFMTSVDLWDSESGRHEKEGRKGNLVEWLACEMRREGLQLASFELLGSAREERSSYDVWFVEGRPEVAQVQMYIPASWTIKKCWGCVSMKVWIRKKLSEPRRGDEEATRSSTTSNRRGNAGLRAAILRYVPRILQVSLASILDYDSEYRLFQIWTLGYGRHHCSVVEQTKASKKSILFKFLLNNLEYFEYARQAMYTLTKILNSLCFANWGHWYELCQPTAAKFKSSILYPHHMEYIPNTRQLW